MEDNYDINQAWSSNDIYDQMAVLSDIHDMNSDDEHLEEEVEEADYYDEHQSQYVD